MSSLIKMILLLAFTVCICQAQLHSTNSCLCQTLKPGLVGLRSEIKDIQIYRETIFCPTVEIRVTMKNGHHYCLDPEKMSKILNVFKRKQRSLK